MDSALAQAIDTFPKLLARRLRLGVQTTEDSVRYTFYAALLQAGVPPERLVLESSDRGRSRQETDMVLLGSDVEPVAALEFKYHRENPSGRNQARTYNAGRLFGDLGRLLTLPSIAERVVVYVTDREMASYLSNPHNGLHTVFNLPPAGRLHLGIDFFGRRPQWFHEGMERWPCPAVVECVAASSLPDDHLLRIWRVEPTETRS